MFTLAAKVMGYKVVVLDPDPHSPAEYRVNGMVPNIPAFYSAFDVKPGDKLYLPPEKRVKVW